MADVGEDVRSGPAGTTSDAQRLKRAKVRLQRSAGLQPTGSITVAGNKLLLCQAAVIPQKLLDIVSQIIFDMPLC